MGHGWCLKGIQASTILMAITHMASGPELQFLLPQVIQCYSLSTHYLLEVINYKVTSYQSCTPNQMASSTNSQAQKEN